MVRIGAYEAKTHLPQLLERVARGEHIIITRRGKPIAQLTPVSAEQPDVLDTISQMRALRAESGPTLGADLSIRDLIEDGRR